MNMNFGITLKILGPSLFHGIGVVIFVTIIGFLAALLVALLIAIGRISKSKILNRILVIFMEIIRGTPLLVQFFYIYFVFPAIINGIADACGYVSHVNLSATLCGIIGFAINYGCYMSEVIRSAILSVDVGQKEAGLALGFSEKQVLGHFIIPPAIRNSVPVFGNYLVMMVKDTSLLSAISVQELLLRTSTYATQSFDIFGAYTLLAIVYLIISIPMSQIVRIIEKKLNQSK